MAKASVLWAAIVVLLALVALQYYNRASSDRFWESEVNKLHEKIWRISGER